MHHHYSRVHLFDLIGNRGTLEYLRMCLLSLDGDFIFLFGAHTLPHLRCVCVCVLKQLTEMSNQRKKCTTANGNTTTRNMIPQFTLHISMHIIRLHRSVPHTHIAYDNHTFTFSRSLLGSPYGFDIEFILCILRLPSHIFYAALNIVMAYKHSHNHACTLCAQVPFEHIIISVYSMLSTVRIHTHYVRKRSLSTTCLIAVAVVALMLVYMLRHTCTP